MKKYLYITATFLLLGLPVISQAHLPTNQTIENTTIAPMLEKVTPAVVNVFVKEKVQMRSLSDLMPSYAGDDRKVPIQGAAVGSGVIFDAAKGLIVTNAHVLKDAKVITVTLKNAERYHAKLLAKDDGYDIAILQIQAKNLTALSFADSDKVKSGDFVTAIGSPYGLAQTVTSGVVSAVDRTHPKIEGYQSFIQTDAPINLGNSGGALVDMQGGLIGINTAMVAPSDGNIGIGFSIPSNMVKGVIEQLLKYGKVEHAMLGLIVQNITPELADALNVPTTKGAVVTQVVPNSPAASAGFKAQDVITEVDNHPVLGSVQLRNMLGLIRPNTQVTIGFIRDRDNKSISVTVINPKELKKTITSYFAGVRLQDFNELESDNSRLKGLLVTGVSDSSEGALAGLATGDVITEINSKAVTALNELQPIIANQSKPILLHVTRGSKDLLLVLDK